MPASPGLTSWLFVLSGGCGDWLGRAPAQVFQRAVQLVDGGDGGGVAGGHGGVIGTPVADLDPGQLGQDEDVRRLTI